MSGLSESDSTRYPAYISYSHHDEKWANWLHKKLEGYRIPRRLVGRQTASGIIPKRIAPVFRDREELSSATDLGETITKALRDSANLIVVCSPQAAASRWVNEEILTFKRLGRSDSIFCFVIDGEPNASDMPDRADNECFSSALRYQLSSDGQLSSIRTEPIAADAREGKDGKSGAKLKLIAGIIGVGFDDLKHRDQHRRYYRMATVTAVALAVTVLTSGLAIWAIVAERQALEHQKQAENLVVFILADLRERLESAGKLEVLDAVGDEAINYFDTLDEHELTPETLQIRSEAMALIGEVRMAQGRLDPAMDAFQRSLSDAERLVSRNPFNDKAQYLSAQANFWIGYVHREQGDFDQTLDRFQKYLDISTKQVEREPQNEKWLRELGYAYTNLGTVFESHGRAQEALEHFQGARTIAETLLQQNPNDSTLLFDVAEATSWVGTALSATGDLEGAFEQFRNEVSIKSSLVATDPQNTRWKRRLSLGHRRMGEILEAQGELDEAHRHYRAGIGIVEQLIAFDPSNSNWQQDGAVLHVAVGRIALATGRVQDAQDEFADHIDVIRMLLREDEGKASWNRGLAKGLILKGRAFRLTGDPAKAESAANEAVGVLSTFLSGYPEDRDAIRLLSEAYLLQERWHEALELVEPLAQGSNDYRILQIQAQALLHLDRIEQAKLVVDQLSAAGFAHPAFIELCNQRGLLAKSTN